MSQKVTLSGGPQNKGCYYPKCGDSSSFDTTTLLLPTLPAASPRVPRVPEVPGEEEERETPRPGLTSDPQENTARLRQMPAALGHGPGVPPHVQASHY
ncbi:hypothetical protein NHX12_008583 [Muraenolepis orangiensis]|uniref:Uncharacterized protein n=1 Tax=Muraenolepis orangiensis TaxID=630683 RepID=A0A9Q0DLL8_9TELE|nr:hypothetical protein NHX12_008583 [Muraenolepis orangiensis]